MNFKVSILALFLGIILIFPQVSFADDAALKETIELKDDRLQETIKTLKYHYKYMKSEEKNYAAVIYGTKDTIGLKQQLKEAGKKVKLTESVGGFGIPLLFGITTDAELNEQLDMFEDKLMYAYTDDNLFEKLSIEAEFSYLLKSNSIKSNVDFISIKTFEVNADMKLEALEKLAKSYIDSCLRLRIQVSDAFHSVLNSGIFMRGPMNLAEGSRSLHLDLAYNLLKFVEAASLVVFFRHESERTLKILVDLLSVPFSNNDIIKDTSIGALRKLEADQRAAEKRRQEEQK